MTEDDELVGLVVRLPRELRTATRQAALEAEETMSTFVAAAVVEHLQRCKDSKGPWRAALRLLQANRRRSPGGV